MKAAGWQWRENETLSHREGKITGDDEV